MRSTFIGVLIFVSGLNGFAGTLTGKNSATQETSGSTQIIYFPISAATCADASLYPNSLSALDTTLTTAPGLKFDFTPTKTMTAINGGTAPTAADDVVLRVEKGSATTRIALHALESSCTDAPTCTTGIGVGTIDYDTLTFGIKFKDGAGNGYCDVVESGTCVLSTDTNTPTAHSIRVGMIKRTSADFASDSNSDYVDVSIMLVGCPAHSSSGLTFPTLNYSLIPGDTRIKVSNSSVAPQDVVGLKSIIVYGTKQSTTVTVDNTRDGRGFQTEISGTAGGTYTLTGLDNDSQYCIGLGYLNKGGWVTTSNFITTPALEGVISTGTLPPSQYCTTPSQIEGFLDRSSCFIASAAYGDEWDVRLETLRQFRDQILGRTQAGENFIEWYYAWSPKAAHWVFDHPVYRPVIRFFLTPLVYIATIAIWIRENLWVLSMFFLVATMLGTFVGIRRLRRGV